MFSLTSYLSILLISILSYLFSSLFLIIELYSPGEFFTYILFIITSIGLTFLFIKFAKVFLQAISIKSENVMRALNFILIYLLVFILFATFDGAAVSIIYSVITFIAISLGLFTIIFHFGFAVLKKIKLARAGIYLLNITFSVIIFFLLNITFEKLMVYFQIVPNANYLYF